MQQPAVAAIRVAVDLARSAVQAVVRMSSHWPGRAARLWIGLLVFRFADAVAAPQTAPEAAEAWGLQQQQQREQEERRQRALERRPDVTLPTPAPTGAAARRLPLDEQPCQLVREVRIDGTTRAPVLARYGEALEGPARDDPPQGRCLGAAGIALLVSRLQDALMAAGYVTTRVLVPAQDLAPGVLRLTILPGRLHRVRVTAGSSPSLRLSNALALREGDLLDLRELEQALEVLQRASGAQVSLQIAPAADTTEPGYSDLLVSYRGGRAWRWQMALDDSGSEAAGRYPAAVTVSLDQPLWANDLFYASWQRDGDSLVHAVRGSEGVRGGAGGLSLHYSWPWRHTLVGLSYSRQDFQQLVQGAFQPYRYRGRTTQAELKLTHLLWRDGRFKLNAWWRLMGRSARNYIEDTEVEVQRRRTGGWEAGLMLRRMSGAWRGDVSVALRRGTGAFHALPAPEAVGAEGGAWRARLVTAELNASAVVPLGARALHLSSHWRGQYALAPVTAPDRFAIGGRYSVRGFAAEQALADDHGLLARHEVALPLSTGAAVASSLYAALDAGVVRPFLHATERRSQTLVGLALGLRLTGGSAALFQLDVFAGTPVRAPASLKATGAVAGFNLSLSL